MLNINKCLKINFCAAPSSGKTTVCSALESMLKKEGIIVETSKEYARHYINTYGTPKDLWEQLIIFENQDIRDKSIAKVSQVLLSDTPAAGYIFGKRMLNNRLKNEGRKEFTKAEYKFLEELHLKNLKKVNWFDLIFVFPPLEVINDGTRKETNEDAINIYKGIVGFLDSENINYILVEGTVDDKIYICYSIIKDMLDKVDY